MLVFNLGDFLDAPSVAAAFELGFEPRFQDVLRSRLIKLVARQANNVDIVVLPRQAGHIFVGHSRGAHAMNLVGRNAHADAGGTHQNAAVSLTAGHFVRHFEGVVRIIDAVGGCWAFICDLVSLRFEPWNELLF